MPALARRAASEGGPFSTASGVEAGFTVGGRGLKAGAKAGDGLQVECYSDAVMAARKQSSRPGDEQDNSMGSGWMPYVASLTSQAPGESRNCC